MKHLKLRILFVIQLPLIISDAYNGFNVLAKPYTWKPSYAQEDPVLFVLFQCSLFCFEVFIFIVKGENV